MVKPPVSIWNLIILLGKTRIKNIYLDVNNLYSYTTSTFLPAGEYQWRAPENFDFDKYSSNSWKCCVLSVYLEYPKELWEFHDTYRLAPGKMKIKKINVV